MKRVNARPNIEWFYYEFIIFYLIFEIICFIYHSINIAQKFYNKALDSTFMSDPF